MSTTTIIATIGATTVTAMGEGSEGAHHIGCTRCGESVTYRFEQFTLVEARRHEVWCAKHKAVK